MSAPNWKDEIDIVYEIYKVSPTVDCTDTIARTAGKYTTRMIWIEWATPAFVEAEVAALIADGWVVESLGAPSKPQEEMDICNTSIIARKRSTP